MEVFQLLDKGIFYWQKRRVEGDEEWSLDGREIGSSKAF